MSGRITQLTSEEQTSLNGFMSQLISNQGIDTLDVDIVGKGFAQMTKDAILKEIRPLMNYLPLYTNLLEGLFPSQISDNPAKRAMIEDILRNSLLGNKFAE